MRFSWLLSFVILSAQAHAQTGASSTTATIQSDAADVEIRSSRINLKQGASQSIDAQAATQGSRPALDTALSAQFNIQVVPTPLRNTNISLDGLSGEHVALWWDGDPILGRLDGALDARTVALGNTDKVLVYHGIDSLPYGSQNIAGVVSLETPWQVDEKLVELRSSGGNLGRTVLAGRGQLPLRDGWSAMGSVANWRSDALRANPDSEDTLIDATARLSASMQVSRTRAGTLGGKDVDVRLGGSGFSQDSKGVFGGERTEGAQRRMHVYGDARRGNSTFHLSYGEFRSHYLADSYDERAVRVGPTVQETTGSWTLFAGSQLDAHATKGSRISALATEGPSIEQVSVGSHLGARYAFNDNWVAGLGTRWDTGPKLFSPRAEVRYLFQAGAYENATVLETGLGFREVTPKERYYDFSNPTLRYRVIGNPDLLTERAWMTALRHTARNNRMTFTGALFRISLSDAIGFVPVNSTGKELRMTYGNVGQTVTHGAQAGGEYRFDGEWRTGLSYQWLKGRNLTNDTGLFLQPQHRVTMTAGRAPLKGLSLLEQVIWTGRQGFFDSNRNGKLDDEMVPAYWMATSEVGYAFRMPGVSELVKLFGRVDNAFNVTNPESFPIEPRAFLMGAAVEL